MKYLKILIFGIPILTITVSLFLINPFNIDLKSNQENINIYSTSIPIIKSNLPSNSEKIEIFYFHSNQRCVACINLNQYTKEVVEKIFSQEVNSDKISFREINIDFPGNRQLARDYNVSGSSLYITVIKEGQRYKEEDTDVWRYITNKKRFINYFEAKIKKLL